MRMPLASSRGLALAHTVETDRFAVRSKDGRYLGTLEVTQDAGLIRALEGQRRLLEYRTGGGKCAMSLPIAPETTVGEVIEAYPELLVLGKWWGCDVLFGPNL